MYTVVKFKNVNFTSVQLAAFGSPGACIYASSGFHDSSTLRNDYVHVVMESITADKNSEIDHFQQSCIISLFAMETLVLLPWLAQIPYNIGSVFGLLNTKIVLDGMLHFKNNFTYIGSAFHVSGSIFCTKKWSHCKIHWKLSNGYWRSNICIQ